MRPSVRKAFRPFTAEFEGVCNFAYLDNASPHGLVTTGIGNLIDASPSAAPWRPTLRLPWKRKDGTPASDAEKIQDWERVKGKQAWKAKGGGIYATISQLRLTWEDVDTLVFQKLDEHDAIMRQRFPAFEEWCGDLQLLVHSIAWACGAWFEFPKLVYALRDLDLETALLECHINENGKDRIPGTADDNRGLRPRNVANKILVKNADRVRALRLDPETVHYPANLAALEQNLIDTARELGNPPSDPELDDPVLEEDGGASRREATLDAATEAFQELAKRRSDDPT